MLSRRLSCFCCKQSAVSLAVYGHRYCSSELRHLALTYLRAPPPSPVGQALRTKTQYHTMMESTHTNWGTYLGHMAQASSVGHSKLRVHTVYANRARSVCDALVAVWRWALFACTSTNHERPLCYRGLLSCRSGEIDSDGNATLEPTRPLVGHSSAVQTQRLCIRTRVCRRHTARRGAAWI